MLKISQKFSIDNLDYSNIIHIVIGDKKQLLNNNLVMMIGVNFLLEDLFYVNELFRLWNYQRNGMNIQKLPMVSSYNIDYIISTYFGNIRAFFFGN